MLGSHGTRLVIAKYRLSTRNVSTRGSPSIGSRRADPPRIAPLIVKHGCVARNVWLYGSKNVANRGLDDAHRVWLSGHQVWLICARSCQSWPDRTQCAVALIAHKSSVAYRLAMCRNSVVKLICVARSRVASRARSRKKGTHTHARAHTHAHAHTRARHRDAHRHHRHHTPRRRTSAIADMRSAIARCFTGSLDNHTHTHTRAHARHQHARHRDRHHRRHRRHRHPLRRR